MGRIPLSTAGAVALLLTGCALGPDFHRPEAPAATHLVAPAGGSLLADGQAQHFSTSADLPGQWWQRLGSPQIDTLVAQALERSPGLHAAQATLRQSEDSLKAGYGVFLPQIGAGVAASRQNALFNAGHGLSSTGAYDLGTANLNASWALDLFGAQRRTVEALAAQAEVQRYLVLATYLELSGNVVNAGIASAGYAAQHAAVVAIINSQDEQLAMAQAQYDAGVAPYSAVLALRSTRATNEANLAALEQRMGQNRHLLAQLCGSLPSQFAPPELVLERITLPAELPAALPSSLVRRRPDILAAEAALHRASAEIGVATADLFPTLTLGGAAGMGHAQISDLLHAGTKYWSAQANLAGSLFNGGAQWYTRKAAIDAYDASLAQYEQTVLAAFEQVADAMEALEHDAQGLRAQVQARDAARENLKLVRAGFEAGTAGYLDVVTAESLYQQALVGYAGAVTQRMQDTVALYAAVGGGWWSADAPAAARP